MKTKTKTRMITKLMVGAVLATASLTGCAIHPLNYDTTGSTKRMFVGFTTGPEELVEIQAFPCEIKKSVPFRIRSVSFRSAMVVVISYLTTADV